jgi:hypothetical protein
MIMAAARAFFCKHSPAVMSSGIGKALIMLHQARHAASPDTATVVIKTAQYDQ